ncbi:MAG: acetate/propionate family kinase [Helicobacteraceae bacterium]|nr:acetate/propionate family kinase [Helicobacteraceae bacterium]
MNILVINSGSSSIKYKLFCMKNLELLQDGLIEKIGEDNSSIKSHHEALLGIFESVKNFDSIAHRVVHGAEEFESATIITPKVIELIEELIPLAPLHNPANLDGIKISKELYPEVTQVAVFDTAFHQSMPKHSFLYALPTKLYEQSKIRRYGFHGTSHFYVAKECAKFLNDDLKKLNLITLHLGNGASACAIENGVSVDTSMGFTPLEGLVMGTRSGDIDSAIVFHLVNTLGYTLDEVDKLLNKQSGLVGICGSNDVREILNSSNSSSKLAIDIMAYRIKKYIGSYIAILGRVDAIIFTGGIGENSAVIRSKVLDGLDLAFNIEEDSVKNEEKFDKISLISKDSSKIKLFAIKTNEELEIAKQSYEVINE